MFFKRNPLGFLFFFVYFCQNIKVKQQIMSTTEKEQIKLLVVRYFIRFLKEEKKYFWMVAMLPNHPFYNFYSSALSNTSALDYHNLKELLDSIDANRLPIESDTEVETYITILINALVNIFIESKGIYAPQELYFIGKGIYDKVCAKMFGKDCQEMQPKSIDELNNLYDLFGFIQNEYFEEQKEQTKPYLKISYVDFLKNYFKNYKESLIQWANKNNISFEQLNDFANNVLNYASKNQ